MKRYIFIIIIAAFCACSNSPKSKVINDFPKTFQLKGERVEIGNNVYDQLYVVDTFLFAYSAFRTEGFIDIYSSKSLRYLGNLARRGHGDNEFLSLSVEKDDFIVSDNETKIWVYDELQNLYNLINVTKSMRDSTTTIERVHKLPKNTISSRSINDSTLLLLSLSESNDGFTYNRYDVNRRTSTPIDIIGEKTMVPDFSLLDTKIAFVNPMRTKAFIFFTFLNKIKIRSLPDNATESTISVYKNEISLKDAKLSGENNSVIFYNDIQFSKDKVWGLYLNQTIDGIMKVAKKVEIHIFDVNGMPVCKLLIPEHIRFFSVDAKNNKIYGATAKDEFYVYDISNLTI